MVIVSSIDQPDLYTWTLGPGVYIIGRCATSNLHVDVSVVSRQHARLEIDNAGNVTLTDLGSHNGTAIDGQLLTSSARLSSSQVFSIGGMGFRVELSQPTDSSDASVNVVDSDTATTAIKLLRREDALTPLPSTVTTNPKAFEAISDFGEMPVLPDSEEMILSKSLELLNSVLPAQRFAICRVDERGDGVSISCHRFDASAPGNTITISRKIAEELTLNGTAILISDTRTDPKVWQRESIIIQGTTSILAAPLFVDGKIWGFMYADTQNRLHHFSEDHLRFTATFANMLAMKIMNHNLLMERQRKEKLEAELGIAAQIQKKLLTADLPRIEGYFVDALQIQCELVGGDIYEVADLGDEDYFLMLADVSDKGIGASLLASNILAAVRVLQADRQHSLVECVQRISQTLLNHSRGEDYATLFIGILNRQSGLFKYVNAGHVPYPALARANNDVELLEATGPPVGLVPSIEWTEQQIEFHAGDSLFAYTDGVTDTTNADGERYGEERMIQLIQDCRSKPHSDITEAIRNAIQEFSGPTPQDDDFTTLLLARTS